MNKSDIRNDYQQVESEIRAIIDSPFREKERDLLPRVYRDATNKFNNYKIQCKGTIQTILAIFPLVMPEFLKKITGNAIKSRLLAPFSRTSLKNYYSDLDQSLTVPVEKQLPKNTNKVFHDFTIIDDFTNYDKLRREHTKKTVFFFSGILLFFIDIVFMAFQYGDSLNDPVVGWSLAGILIVIIAVVSFMSGRRFYATNSKRISTVLLGVACFIDVVSMFLRVLMVYSPDSENATAEGVLYFPDTITDRPDSLVMAIIIGMITLFGILLTRSHAKELFDKEYTQFRNSVNEYSLYVEKIPEFIDLITSLEKYADNNKIEYEKVEN